MRARWLCVLLCIGCTPRIPEGLACGPTIECPPMQTCIDSHCRSTSAVDAAIDVGPHDAEMPDAYADDTNVDAPGAPDMGSDTGADGGPSLLPFDTNEIGSAASVGTVHALVLGDFDNDGDVDIVVGGTTAGTIFVHQSAGVWTAGPSVDATQISAFTSADTNGDLVDDIIGASVASSSLFSTRFETMTSMYVTETRIAGVGAPIALSMGQVGSDGKPDVIMAGSLGVRVYLRSVSGPFNEDSRPVTTPSIAAYGVRDVLLTAGLLVLSTTDTRLYDIGTGGAPNDQTAQLGMTQPLTAPVAAAVVDLNHDDLDDIVMVRAPTAGVPELVVLHQNGQGSFVAAAFPIAAGPTDIALGDLTGDGVPEAIVTQSGGLTSDATQIYDVQTGALVGLVPGAGIRVRAGMLDGGVVSFVVLAPDGAVRVSSPSP